MVIEALDGLHDLFARHFFAHCFLGFRFFVCRVADVLIGWGGKLFAAFYGLHGVGRLITEVEAFNCCIVGVLYTVIADRQDAVQEVADK